MPSMYKEDTMEINIINPTTIEEVKRTTYTKEQLTSQREGLIEQRDRELSELSIRYQPAIDRLTDLLSRFK